jgi:phosphatidylglycerol lysyltransferase
MIGLLRRHGMAAFGLGLLVLALWVMQSQFRTLSVADVTAALAAIPTRALWMAGGFTLLAFAVLTVYDRLGSVYAGHPVSYGRTSLASFVAYSLAQNLGFAAVSGAAVRYRFYAAWGLPPLAIAKVVAFTSLTFALGGFTLGGLVLMWEPEIVPGLGQWVSPWLMRAVGAAMWVLVLAYILMSRSLAHITLFGQRIDLPGFRMAVAQTALASVDVAVTGLIFYSLLPAHEGLSLAQFLGVYIVAYTAGIAASLPGGLGVFDTAMILGLAPWFEPAQVIGALLIFRLFFYILPLFLAGLLFAGFEVAQRRDALARLAAEQRVADALEVPAVVGLVGLSGMALLFLAALPLGSGLQAWAGAEALLASQFALSILGSTLMVLAYGLLRRLTLAWWLAVALLPLAALIIAVRGDGWWLWLALLFVVAVLAAMRSAFYRDARPLREPLEAGTLTPLGVVAIGGLLLGAVSIGGRVAGESWMEVVVSDEAPAGLRLLVGFAAVLLLAGLVRLLRPVRIRPEPWTPAIRARIRQLGGSAPEAADGALFGEAGQAGFAFVRRDKVWLALGDPMGPEADRVSAIWRFRDLCGRAGVDPAFMRVGSGLLRVYGDIGLTAFRLPGEPGAAPRWLVCRAERDLQLLLPLVPAEPSTPPRR